jgi:UDP-N-acetylglucosamine--N-acetylmuramyl-(pentapeptide) pyrophosphoryl-undecaprenol N-acetylglucosamine transferase
MKIVLTGGGTAGHVTPNIALLPRLREMGYEVSYIGSYKGMEKELIENAGVTYYGIDSGKLRRYFDLHNFSDPFKVIHGLEEAWVLLGKIKPDIVFSKGGFVSVPVVIAAHMRHIPVIIHESDMTPGLANKLCFSSASKVCCNFPETIEHLPAGKAVLSGSPIREELLSGSAAAGHAFTGLDSEKPVLMIIGGSLGSVVVNNAVRECLDRLLGSFHIVHICGKGHIDDALKGKAGYAQYEYITDELKDVFAMSDIVISRAGANAICELLALRKPNILIPLSAAASRGDQILNADSFRKQGFSAEIYEEDLTADKLFETVMDTYGRRDSYIAAMEASGQSDAISIITGLITELTAK